MYIPWKLPWFCCRYLQSYIYSYYLTLFHWDIICLENCSLQWLTSEILWQRTSNAEIISCRDVTMLCARATYYKLICWWNLVNIVKCKATCKDALCTCTHIHMYIPHTYIAVKPLHTHDMIWDMQVYFWHNMIYVINDVLPYHYQILCIYIKDAFYSITHEK